MLDPIRDSWEARIRSMRMSSKNLIGENAEKTEQSIEKSIYKCCQIVIASRVPPRPFGGVEAKALECLQGSMWEHLGVLGGLWDS